MDRIDVREHPEVIEAINNILNNRSIAEIKKERDGIAVVEIKRTLKTTR